MPIHNLESLRSLMRFHGAKKIFAKTLAANDNSKNQVYFGGDFSALNIIPHKQILTDSDATAGSKRDRAKAKINFSWVDEKGIYEAPNAQLVLYPKYPEVRFSGFLLGCREAPNEIMRVRDPDRVLFMGITDNGQVLGYAAAAASPLASEFIAANRLNEVGIFREIPLSGSQDSKAELLTALKHIYEKNWIESKKLGPGGIAKLYRARNGGGYTLEAELGVTPNAYAEPDFLGWEIKQFSVTNFDTFRAKTPVTLFTPEPSGGYYKEAGLIPFIDRYGYADKSGKTNRRNFGGVYTYSADFHKDTGLRLSLTGYDSTKGIITDMTGGLLLIDKNDEPAAVWTFPSILEHWNRKHARAAYVPSLYRNPPPEYRYGPKILLCEGTDFSRFLKAITESAIYLDPALKLVRHPGQAPESKRRNQFRIKHKQLNTLYDRTEIISL